MGRLDLLGWLKQWAREGDLLAQALTGVPTDPECRMRQILRRMAALHREHDALSLELFALREVLHGETPR